MVAALVVLYGVRLSTQSFGSNLAPDVSPTLGVLLLTLLAKLRKRQPPSLAIEVLSSIVVIYHRNLDIRSVS